MDDDDRELANRLSATATAMLEDVVQVAIAGQSPRQNPSQLADHGHHLQTVTRDIAIIADTAIVVAGSSISQAKTVETLALKDWTSPAKQALLWS